MSIWPDNVESRVDVWDREIMKGRMQSREAYLFHDLLEHIHWQIQ
ncbi:hypothetical protein M7I_0611 [Glarea lozoyensis 74030]|uniref:Uncharacterized protein n=1 Tax=Glarea lozoyensis (strain ATCC 74030 / MF5533) TaxID=1104152 RepID=H0EDG3_GLAL7|nr:hypothetical protein M7I_0611 [Glarea lozoyensis 74030]